MSYFGDKAQAKKDAMEGDMQIDDLMTTSPVRDGGGMEAGAAPLSGKSEFTNERTRTKQVGNTGGPRREWPSEGVSSKSGL
jgi:hypothetical protein